ncbi:MAG: response regulator [bacterium]
MKVLVVDDDKDIRDVIGVLMEMDGHSVSLAANYNEALSKVECELFDLVITDYRMPRMHGLYLLEMIKDINPHLPVIIITAYQTDEMKKEARKKGVDLLMTKPFEYGDLLAGVKKVMRKCRKSAGTKKQ